MMSEKNKKVLTFNRDDKFYYQRANRLIDNMEYIRGIKMLNFAITKNPKNTEYRLSFCEVLSDIGYYSKSNEEIIKIMVIDKDINPQCYYMLGYNYYELGEYIKALNMFEKYLSINPTGELSDEAFLFLENIEDFTLNTWQEYSMFPSHIYSTKSDITNIDETRMSDDIDVWAREQNIKALMAYSKKEFEESIKICRNILNKLPRLNGVLCTLALALNKNGETSESIEIAKALVNSSENNEDDMFRVSFVLCELKMDSEAKELLKKLKTLMPYTEKINHYLAVAYYNCKDYENARKLWNTCLEIDSGSYMYQWYIEQTLNPIITRIEYNDYLPDSVLLENIRYLEELTAQDKSDTDEEIWNDEKFKKIFFDTLEKCNDEVQKRLIHIIFNQAGKEREVIFRTFLLSDYISEKNKNEILSFLHHIEAKEPFLMMTDYQLVDVAINVISVDNNSKNDFIQVLNYAVDNICKDKREKEMVIALWSSVAIKFMIANKRIRKTSLWAVGFYFVAMKDKYLEEVLLGEAQEHGVSKKSLKDIAKMIMEKKGEKHDY